MNLEDLNELARVSKDDYIAYKNNDVILPSDFKSKFASLLESTTSEKITFSQYSATIKTQNGLIIIFPNQWFFIASYFVPFTIELKRYKDIFNSIFKDLNITKQLKESKIIPDDIDKLINQYFDQELDKIYFKKFITDYSWWFGSKYINRSDFYISSILNLANVVNDSQGYIAELTNKLTESEELYNILKVLAKKQLSKREGLLTDIILYETESIRDFALFVFEKFYSKNWSSVLGNSEIKIAKINSLEFNSYDFIDFKRVIAEFDYELSKEELSSSGTLRYFEKPLLVLNDRYFYFSTQWNGDDQRDLSFKNLKKYFEYNFNSYKLIKLNNSYQLLKVSNFNDKFLNNVNNSGLNFDINIINRFIASLCSKPFLIGRVIGCLALWTAVCCIVCCIALEFQIFTSKKFSSSHIVNCGLFNSCVAIIFGYLSVSVGCIIASWINSSYVGFL